MVYDAFAELMNAGRKAPLLPWSKPSAPASIARPQAPAPSPAAPVSNWAPAPVYNAPAYRAPSYGGGGAVAITQPAQISAPAPAPEKPKLSEADISKMAEVDSTFTDQKSAYANALKKYIADSDRQKGILQNDSKTALTGIERNKTVGLTGLSEDFASRGLANSGMFADNLTKAGQQYEKQKTGVETGLTNSLDDLSFRRAKYESENGANGTNVQAARREAYARLAAAQNLT